MASDPQQNAILDRGKLK
uniref:Uncharacterized protein n=1 Tax=Anguilla anguilla TaxID=7936 RepID=A0A0E9TF97_ANGAN